MSSPMPPRRVPTLTEIVDWPPAGSPIGLLAEPVHPPLAASPTPLATAVSEAAMPNPAHTVPSAPQSPPLAAPAAISEEQLVQRVLTGLQRQIDLMLDYRLREALTPLLTRAADGIVREARTEISASVRDVVERAVAQELARLRTR